MKGVKRPPPGEARHNGKRAKDEEASQAEESELEQEATPGDSQRQSRPGGGEEADNDDADVEAKNGTQDEDGKVGASAGGGGGGAADSSKRPKEVRQLPSIVRLFQISSMLLEPKLATPTPKIWPFSLQHSAAVAARQQQQQQHAELCTGGARHLDMKANEACVFAMLYATTIYYRLRTVMMQTSYTCWYNGSTGVYSHRYQWKQSAAILAVGPLGTHDTAHDTISVPGVYVAHIRE